MLREAPSQQANRGRGRNQPANDRSALGRRYAEDGAGRVADLVQIATHMSAGTTGGVTQRPLARQTDLSRSSAATT
jgi:hypothetical protein